jgi:hypothetical protein
MQVGINRQLCLGEDQPVLGHLGLERLPAVLQGGQIVALSARTHPDRRE